ncbi:TPA: hypothetical protein DDZ86_02605 [Candidatus Dependentiae bacterium]|nr:MAG: Glycerol-3-phosphate dehydrogenase [NAD(P)+] [candidate division TM6 bacterium GW2011_GWF2_43_87]HBL98510.1 hypothetical protein [Candidatus Dependentiae bacterium]
MNVTVLGDGAWGTACAALLAHNKHKVLLWCFNQDVERSITLDRENATFLPGVKLPMSITAITEVEEALENDVVFQAVPVSHVRSVLTSCKPFARADHIWVSLSKGIESGSLFFPTDLIRDVLGSTTVCAAISGPSFALDVAQKQLTVVALAAEDEAVGALVQKLVESKFLKCELSDDLSGIQVAGAFKNIFALGAGFLKGAGFGCNTQVFFVLKSLRELEVLLGAVAGHAQSLYGPAGLGDIMLTCFSEQSRNMQAGVQLGAGKELKMVLASGISTAEGINTLVSVCALAQRLNIELSLCFALYNVIFKKASVSQILDVLRG